MAKTAWRTFFSWGHTKRTFLKATRRKKTEGKRMRGNLKYKAISTNTKQRIVSSLLLVSLLTVVYIGLYIDIVCIRSTLLICLSNMGLLCCVWRSMPPTLRKKTRHATRKMRSDRVEQAPANNNNNKHQHMLEQYANLSHTYVSCSKNAAHVKCDPFFSPTLSPSWKKSLSFLLLLLAL